MAHRNLCVAVKLFSLSIDLKLNYNAESDLGQVIMLIMNHLLRTILHCCKGDFFCANCLKLRDDFNDAKTLSTLSSTKLDL